MQNSRLGPLGDVKIQGALTNLLPQREKRNFLKLFNAKQCVVELNKSSRYMQKKSYDGKNVYLSRMLVFIALPYDYLIEFSK